MSTSLRGDALKVTLPWLVTWQMLDSWRRLHHVTDAAKVTYSGDS
jgi:hypothetical protein